jgi:hypothetical protein
LLIGFIESQTKLRWNLKSVAGNRQNLTSLAKLAVGLSVAVAGWPPQLQGPAWDLMAWLANHAGGFTRLFRDDAVEARRCVS